MLLDQNEAVHRLAGVYVYPHHVDEYGKTMLDMSITTRRFIIVFAHQLVSKVLLAPTVTKDGPTFTEDYSDVCIHTRSTLSQKCVHHTNTIKCILSALFMLQIIS